MKLLLCLTILITLSLSYRDLQNDVYKPFDKEELQKTQPNKPSTYQPSSNEDPFTSTKRPASREKNQNTFPTNDLKPGHSSNQRQQSFQDEENSERKQYNKQFNEILKYGLIIGSIFLVFILIKACIVTERPHRRNYRHQRRQPQQVQMVHQPASIPRTIGELELEIQKHKNEISRLSSIKERMLAYRQVPTRQETESVRFREVEGGVQYRNNIPVGRPIPRRDNDSSFASEYPTL